MRYATGRHALAICDRCGLQRRYTELVADGHVPGWRVCRPCRDTKHPQEKPVRTDEGIALKYPRPNREDDETIIHSGTAQAGSASGITLASTAPAIASRVIGQNIEITGGTGSGQERTISGYDGSSKVAAVSVAWTVVPDGTSTYEVTPALLATSMAFEHTFGGGT